MTDREEATKEDDLGLGETLEEEEEGEEEEWEGDTDWNVDNDDAEGDVKDESTAYLEFLNEEVSHWQLTGLRMSAYMLFRPKSSAPPAVTTTTNWKKKDYWKLRLTRSSPTNSSSSR